MNVTYTAQYLQCIIMIMALYIQCSYRKCRHYIYNIIIRNRFRKVTKTEKFAQEYNFIYILLKRYENSQRSSRPIYRLWLYTHPVLPSSASVG